MPDSAAGFGATEQTDNNSEEIRRLLNQARDLMIEDGTDPATAEALVGYAMPVAPAFSGNFADLNRMGQIAAQGQIETPPGQDNVQTSNLNDAFTNTNPPGVHEATQDTAGGGDLQTPMAQIDEEGNPTGDTEDGGDGGGGDAAADDGGDDGGGDQPVDDSMTKAELEAEANRRGISVTSSMTKAEMIEAINNG